VSCVTADAGPHALYVDRVGEIGTDHCEEVLESDDFAISVVARSAL
jgi:hypothetical protein